MNKCMDNIMSVSHKCSEEKPGQSKRTESTREGVARKDLSEEVTFQKRPE